jgi:exo-1,4-beta-D-glucosaminidase
LELPRKERFTTVNVFTDGLTRRYGAATSLDDYERKAQAMTYDGQRAMFEAYGRNKYVATGVIQWMLNNSWPSLIWHLYDYYLVPSGGYFGTKKACEPVHVQYAYDDNTVGVVNSTYESFKGMKVSARIFNIDAQEKGSRDAMLDIASDSSTKAFELPKVDGLSTTYFLRLQLRNGAGELVSDNFYWLSTKADTLDWARKKDTVYTPQKEFADLTGLNSLPQINLTAGAVTSSAGGKERIAVIVKNPSKSVAFMTHLRLTRGAGGDDLVPVFWSDNYFSLLPGEERRVTGTYDVASREGKPALLIVDGFNVVSNTVHPASAGAGAAN